MNGQSAKLVAVRLKALAREIERQPCLDEHEAILIAGFVGVARALESAKDPPAPGEVLALLKIITAGHAALCDKHAFVPLPMNDVA